MTTYLRVLKDQRGYRVDGMTSIFKTYNELKNYYERTAMTKVKFIKMF